MIAIQLISSRAFCPKQLAAPPTNERGNGKLVLGQFDPILAPLIRCKE